ncbi:MAG: hypothetical protein JNM22_12085 [Saprospiraceae bacterium]|nr:hypothetical protein [Saprospiraceae bacterium]
MNQYQRIPVQLADGSTIIVEIRQPQGEENVSFSKFNISEILGKIESIANSFMDTLRKTNPQKATIEFGMDIAIESGALTALIAKGTAEANLKITLEWEKSKTNEA